MAKTKHIFPYFAIMVLAVFLAGCAQKDENPSEQSQPNSARVEVVTSGSNDKIIQPAQDGYKEFQMTARRFEFVPSDIVVNRGDKVRLIVTSTDVTHGIAIPEYGINKKLPAGVPVTIEFTADKQGTFTVFCSVVCGTGHSGMKGQLIVR